MLRPSLVILAALGALTPAAAQVPLIRPGAVQAIGPKQDDPLVCPDGELGIVVQGGLVGRPGDDTDPQARTDVLAIGPKQDDPLAIGPKQDDPRAIGVGGGASTGLIVQGGRVARPGDDNDPLAIGPKQDDPRAIVVQGGLVARPGDDNDPHAHGGMLAIGPKQDDPRAPGARTACRKFKR